MAGKSSKGRSRRGVHNSAHSLESTVIPDAAQNRNLSIPESTASECNGCRDESKAPGIVLNEEDFSCKNSENRSIQELRLYSVPVQAQNGEKIELQLNPGDSVMDVRQFLLDAPETCYITCYELLLHQKNGLIHHLEEYSEISEVADITASNCHLEMVPALYDDRSIRAHVQRTRELLSLSSLQVSLSTSLALREDTTQAISSSPQGAELQDIDCLASLDDVTCSLHKLFPSSSKEIRYLEHLIFSSFNPPPSYRRLAGDLIYLDIVTLENHKFCVTGSTRNFYVNSSSGNVLDPRSTKTNYEDATLIDLLQKISAKFKKAFHEILERRASIHPFENVQSLLSPSPWLGVYPVPDHKRDAARAESALMFSYGSELIGMQRDWNEELQACREFPRSTPQERILRDRALYKVTSDFVDASINGAIGVINRCISPINPTDPECFHMYMHNNIFFSFAVDSDIEIFSNKSRTPVDSEDDNLPRSLLEVDAENLFPETNIIPSGGPKLKGIPNGASKTVSNNGAFDSSSEQATYASANNDLKGTKAYQDADIPGLYNLAMAVIDYRGYRVIAQSVLPGILQGDKSNSLLYGSVDNGKRIFWNADFHAKVREAANCLHLKEHSVFDGSGNVLKLAAPVECKGIMGSDDRHYILDLMHTTPRDANYMGSKFRFCILRPELLTSFCQDGKKASGDDHEHISNCMESGERGKNLFNPNVFTEFRLAGSKEEIAEDEKLVMKLSLFLKETVVPKFIEDLCTLEISPMDGQALQEALHANGINIRYIGKVAHGAKHLPHIWDLCTNEIVVRCAKHVLKFVLRDTEDHDLSAAISHLLNCLFGYCEALSGYTDTNMQSKISDTCHYQFLIKSNKGLAMPKNVRSGRRSKFIYMMYSSESFWSEIFELSRCKYQFELPQEAKSCVRKISVLRNLCQKVGIRISAREYKLDGSRAFELCDVLDVHHVVKHSIPVCAEARSMVESGKVHLGKGMLREAYGAFSEALVVLEQVTGPMHRDVASCCRYLAMVLYHAGDVGGAIMQQHKELIINERCLGLDHPDTGHSYGNLALFYHGLNQTETGLRHMSHALVVLSVSCGPDHPDVASMLINVAMMYQDLGRMDTALRYLQDSLKKNERLLGSDHVQTAVCYHALAIAFNCMGAFRLSHQNEKKTYDILLKQVGEGDPRTRDSYNWMRTFQMRLDLQKKQKQQQQEKKGTLDAILLKAPQDLIRMHHHHQSGQKLSIVPLAQLLNILNSNAATAAPPCGLGSTALTRKKLKPPEPNL